MLGAKRCGAQRGVPVAAARAGCEVAGGAATAAGRASKREIAARLKESVRVVRAEVERSKPD